MGLSFNKYFKKLNDEYIENFFTILNLLIEKTIEFHNVQVYRNTNFIQDDVVFLLKSMTSHYHFTEKHKQKLQIIKCQEDNSEDVSWKFIYDQKFVLFLKSEIYFTWIILILEDFI